MIKLYKDFTDFVWTDETNEVIEELGIDPIPVGSLELRDGREVRITEEEGNDKEQAHYMIVVFSGAYIDEYYLCDNEKEVNQFLIKIQKKK